MAGNANYKPAEMCLVIFESLSDKEKRQVAERIGAVGKDTRSKCQRDGHRYKKVLQRDPLMCGLIQGFVLHVCEHCGDAIRTKFGV